MERFPNLLYWLHTSIWEKLVENIRESGGPFKIKLGRWLDELSLYYIQTGPIRFLTTSRASQQRLGLSQKSDTWLSFQSRMDVKLKHLFLLKSAVSHSAVTKVCGRHHAFPSFTRRSGLRLEIDRGYLVVHSYENLIQMLYDHFFYPNWTRHRHQDLFDFFFFFLLSVWVWTQRLIPRCHFWVIS